MAQSVGSRPGVRLAAQLALPTSATTLLRLERAAPLPARPTPRVLGVDDWAFKKGHHYGTILFDMERRWVVDLLPDRTCETFSIWLRDHSGVEIVSRDRANAYAEAVRQSLPEAVQVADRWHLVKNLGQALEGMLDTKRSLLRQAVQNTPTPSLPAVPVVEAVTTGQAVQKANRATALKACHRQERLERYSQVHTLYGQGMKRASICRKLHLSPKTVRKYLRSADFVDRKERAPQRTGRVLDSFASFLRQRWEEGCHNVAQLCRELGTQGYRGGYTSVHDYVKDWRLPDLPGTEGRQDKVSPRQVALWLLRREEERTARQKSILTNLSLLCEPFRDAQKLTERFLGLVRQKPRTDQKEALGLWLADALAGSATEIRAYAVSLQQDRAAVEAGLSLCWSNGPVEGSNNRLKFIKRRGYGRANFDLLRRRVLQPT